MFTKKKSVLLFLLPGLCMLLLFYIVPFIGGIGYSLTDGSYKNEFVGLQNYRDLWQNPMFQLGLTNTMQLSLICAPLLWVLSFILAAGLMNVRPFGGLFRSTALMPYLMPSSAMLLVWLVLFDYGGPINRALVALGAQRVMWLESGALRVAAVVSGKALIGHLGHLAGKERGALLPEFRQICAECLWICNRGIHR